MGNGKFTQTSPIGGGSGGGGGFSPTPWIIEAFTANDLGDGNDGAPVAVGAPYDPKKEYLFATFTVGAPITTPIIPTLTGIDSHYGYLDSSGALVGQPGITYTDAANPGISPVDALSHGYLMVRAGNIYPAFVGGGPANNINITLSGLSTSIGLDRTGLDIAPGQFYKIFGDTGASSVTYLLCSRQLVA